MPEQLTMLTTLLSAAREELAGVLPLLNNDSHDCKSCGLAEYENWDDHQLYLQLDGMVTKLSNILERRARNADGREEGLRDTRVAHAGGLPHSA